jgi:hypothetical protein
MVLGIVGVLLFVLFAIVSILAVVFGAVAIGQINKSNGWVTGRGMAIAGIVLGSIEIVLFVVAVATGGFHFYFSP